MKSLRVSLACCLFAAVFAAPLTAQDKKLTTVNFGYSAISGSFAPLWVGFEQGLFTKYGIDLKMAYIQGNRVMLSALTAGEIHFYQGGAEGLIRLVSGGGDGIFVATQYNVVGHYVLMTDRASPGSRTCAARGSLSIQRVPLTATCSKCWSRLV
jgi:ABC-type nitrate/sulfonate/bicarbonate transport system substrate-binding protein